MTGVDNQEKTIGFEVKTRLDALKGILFLTVWFWGICSIASLVFIFAGGIKNVVFASAVAFVGILLFVTMNIYGQRIKHKNLSSRFTIEEFEQTIGNISAESMAMLKPDDEICQFETELLSGYVVVRDGKVTGIRYLTSARIP